MAKNKMLFLYVFIIACFVNQATAQQTNLAEPLLPEYKATPSKINDLIHTKLDVHFDYKKCYLYGKEWVTLKPHFYPTDSLRLDAKGMDINRICVVNNGKNIPLRFTYDSLSLHITLDRAYQNTEQYTIYIEYISKPNEITGRRNDEKGLYFINPDSTEINKPVQIWTEGEPESASVWFPTIDKPNQKTTEEISMTVPSKYVTLSNGRLASQKNNMDGSRTDTWKMELPHAPYLFMMAVGDFKIYKDKWHGKEVSYYLEPKYAPYAKDIFGLTPEAIGFFSKTLGVDFPWNKYSQVIVRDYVSGAMENTTATMLGEPVQGTARELVDRYYNTGIQHELFHQWFGDYVTAESWSNLTLNESFADFAEIIWLEYKYGKDAADEHVYKGLQGYLNNRDNKAKSLVNFNYKNIKEVFSGVTYQKGGRILNMLRNYLGNAAFYKGLHIYLIRNAFKSAESQQLRLAMEEASGLDLNWFFNQWYYRAGHPVLNITYKWDEAAKMQTVYLQQTQDGNAFILPVPIDIYTNGAKERHQTWMYDKADTLTFKLLSKPDLVNVNADKVLVCKTNDSKTLDEYFFQYLNAPLFADRYEAIEAASKNMNDKVAQKIIVAALTDKFSGLRSKAISVLTANHEDIRNVNKDLLADAMPVLITLAQKDSNTLVQAAALITLAILKDSALIDVFKKAITSQSYEVQGAALNGITEIDPGIGMAYAKGLENDNLGALTQAIVRAYSIKGGVAQWPFVYSRYVNGTLQEKIHLTEKFAGMIGRIANPSFAQDGIEELKLIAIKYKKEGAASYIAKFLTKIKEQRTILNDGASSKAAADALLAIDNAK